MTSTLIYYFFSYFVISCLLALTFVHLMHPLAFKLGAVDRGTGRRVHKGIIPRLGGVGIFMAFIIPAVFSLTRGKWDASHENIAGILLASVIIFAIGIYDDIKGATVRNKLLGEVLAALIIYAIGIRITTLGNPFGTPFVLGWLSLPATVLWIIIITNAINLIDGLDGLAAGTGILIAMTLFALSGPDNHMKVLYIILSGSLIGFLRFNFPPASIFMGDAGSLFIGFFLGSTSILSSHKATAMATMMIPLIAFSFPLMDMAYAVLRRYYRGLPLGEADKEHIHHKLIEKGFSRKKVLYVIYLINILLMLFALMFVGRQIKADFFALIILAVIATVGIRLLGYIEFIPLIKDILKNYGNGKKRKFYNYIIRRFRRNVAGRSTLKDLEPHLTELLTDYNFTRAEVYLEDRDKLNPVYVFTNGVTDEKQISLSFPLVGRGDVYIGKVLISKSMDDEYFLFTTEMINALAEEIARCVTSEKIAP